MIFNKLKKGDSVGIISPASSFKKESFLKGVEILKSYGLIPVYNENILNETTGYLNNDDNFRVNDFENYLNDEKINVIFCARGGYGSIRTLNKLNRDLLLNKKKLIIGFSDITVFHAFLNKNNIPTLHAPMIASFHKHLPSTEKLFNILFGITKNILFEIKALNHFKQQISGTIVGGNFAVFNSMIGTQFLPDLKNKILFIEDINEPLYKIDRMIMHLKLTQNLPNAIILGQFLDCGNLNDIEKLFVENFDIPVYSNLNVGHFENNDSLPLGVFASIENNQLIIKI